MSWKAPVSNRRGITKPNRVLLNRQVSSPPVLMQPSSTVELDKAEGKKSSSGKKKIEILSETIFTPPIARLLEVAENISPPKTRKRSHSDQAAHVLAKKTSSNVMTLDDFDVSFN